MQNQPNPVQYLITINPGGDVDNIQHLVFNTKDEKEEYIKQEYVALRKYHIAFAGADSNRKVAKTELLKQIVAYATKMGYAPSKTHKTKWVKSTKPTNKVA